jgi:predicted glycosyltransferase involved in capsule biosynthesis
MKVDLNNIGLMIHFRRDVDDRFRNLEMVVKFYRNNSENLKIVLVNDDKELDKGFKDLCNAYSCKGLFMENSDIYWRTKAFNEASKLLDCEYIIAGDTDVIVDPKFILKAKNLFLENHKLGIVYPYNGMFVHLKQQIFEKFKNDQNLNDLVSKSQTLKPVAYDQDDNFLVAHPSSKGGMVMFRKRAFIECNGYNPNFKGWGFEDDEISNRYIKLSWSFGRVFDKDAIAWHLPHENTIREMHPYYHENYKHAEFVGHCVDINILKTYIDSWTI